jgi:hypothetical protein
MAMRGLATIFLLYLLPVWLALGCGTGNSLAGKTTPEPGKNVPAPENLSSDSTVRQIMNYMASDALRGRDSGSEGIEKAALFIEDHLRVNKVNPYFDSYRDTLSNFNGYAYNIVGLVEGNDPELKQEYILIGAHYDHIGILAAQSMDSIANGANDNASGTATVLELARYFGQERSNGRSLIFAFFSAEEKGLLGSKHLAAKLKGQQLPLYVMLNFEMTGVPLIGKGYSVYVTGFDKSNLATVCNAYARDTVVGMLPTAEEFNLFQRSDNYPFHLEFQVPSQTFCTFDFTNFDHYHKVGDEAQLMNMEHMAGLVNTMIPVIEGIANAREKEIKYHRWQR